MRPLELTVEGFKSYRERTTFDWRGRRLVGIVGPIGSGKSSILDAISFALYGKTPQVEGATKALIHQLVDQSHVELRFQVDGQVWRAVRSLRRKGASGHQLELLAADTPDAAVLETITLEAGVTERVEQLLGMDFKTFCRSVLLAQNRFAEFLTATPAQRDAVLKGVFGFERLDDALRVAKSRELTLETAPVCKAGQRIRVGEAPQLFTGASVRERDGRAVRETPQRVELLLGEHGAAFVVEDEQADELAVRLQRAGEAEPMALHVFVRMKRLFRVHEPVERAHGPAGLARPGAQLLFQGSRSRTQLVSRAQGHLWYAGLLDLVQGERVVARDHPCPVCRSGSDVLEVGGAEQHLDHGHERRRRVVVRGARHDGHVDCGQAAAGNGRWTPR